jgi:hypothetical protein
LGLQGRYDFNTHGYVNRVKNARTIGRNERSTRSPRKVQLEQATYDSNVPTTEHLYHAQSGSTRLARGRAARAQWRNSYFDFSAVGNLTSRADVNQGVGERMGPGAYDAQNRLLSAELTQRI